jgi:two-component system, NtrC family, sensor kinase
MQAFSYRPAWRRGLIFLGLLLLALGILGSMIWRNVQHFHTVVAYVNYSHRLQAVSVGLQQSVIEYLTGPDTSVLPAALTQTMHNMERLMADQEHLAASTRADLKKIEAMLVDVATLDKPVKHQRLSAALNAMSNALATEGLQREQMLEDIREPLKIQFKTTKIKAIKLFSIGLTF